MTGRAPAVRAIVGTGASGVSRIATWPFWSNYGSSDRSVGCCGSRFRKIASNTERHLEWGRHLRDVDHLTMAEITAKTGIPRTSLYRHFNRMDDRAVSAG